MAKQTIQADVTGTVWQIAAKVGDELAAGATVMILESMKMEVPVAAPAAGMLAKLLVAEGDPVDEGQDLAVIETA